MEQVYNCYMLYNDVNTRTYTGSTNDIYRRIRQHNGEIKGGARYTTREAVNGIVWSYLLVLTSESLTKRLALSLEWHLKHTKIAEKETNNRIQKLKKFGGKCYRNFPNLHKRKKSSANI